MAAERGLGMKIYAKFKKKTLAGCEFEGSCLLECLQKAKTVADRFFTSIDSWSKVEEKVERRNDISK